MLSKLHLQQQIFYIHINAIVTTHIEYKRFCKSKEKKKKKKRNCERGPRISDKSSCRLLRLNTSDTHFARRIDMTTNTS